jgi:hypothetical protein
MQHPRHGRLAAGIAHEHRRREPLQILQLTLLLTIAGAVRGNAINALAILHAALGLDPNKLRLHKEDPKTTHDCPGKNVIKSDIIDGILTAMASLHPGDHQPGAVASG